MPCSFSMSKRRLADAVPFSGSERSTHSTAILDPYFVSAAHTAAFVSLHIRQPGVKKKVHFSSGWAARASIGRAEAITSMSIALTAIGPQRISVDFVQSVIGRGSPLNRALLGIVFVPVFIVGVVVGVLASPSSAPETAPATGPTSASAETPAALAETPKEASSEPEGEPATESTPETPAQDGFGLAPAKKHYGKVFEGQARRHTFKIERPDNAALRIGRTYSPCPCVYVTAKKPSFEKGAEADVEILIHSLTLNGEQSFPAYVELLEPEKKVLRADVSIEVERVPAKLMLKPDAFHLGAVRGAKSASVELHNLTKRPVTVGNVSCTIDGVEVALPKGKRIAPGGMVTVEVATPESGLPRGPVRGEMRVETNVPEHATIAIPVDGTALR